MDPRTNLDEQLAIADYLLNIGPEAGQSAQRLAELVIELNDWIICGGYLPPQWRMAYESPSNG